MPELDPGLVCAFWQTDGKAEEGDLGPHPAKQYLGKVVLYLASTINYSLTGVGLLEAAVEIPWNQQSLHKNPR